MNHATCFTNVCAPFSKGKREISLPSALFLELCSLANLPCLVKLAHSVYVIIVQLHILAISV